MESRSSDDRRKVFNVCFCSGLMKPPGSVPSALMARPYASDADTESRIMSVACGFATVISSSVQAEQSVVMHLSCWGLEAPGPMGYDPVSSSRFLDRGGCNSRNQRGPK